MNVLNAEVFIALLIYLVVMMNLHNFILIKLIIMRMMMCVNFQELKVKD